jgi:hypothetical protein
MASLSDIQILADKVAREFRLEKIILFGSRRGAMPSQIPMSIV